MRRFLKCLSLLLVWICQGSCFAQSVNTEGRDFWVSFLPNSASSSPKLELLVAGRTSCKGEVRNPHTGWSSSFTVTPGKVTSILIPKSEGMVGKQNNAERKALHVTTTADVSLYASNFVDASYDVANVLPTAILKDNYIALSHYSGPQSNMNAKMLIVATENNTEITIDPKGGLRGFFPSFTKKNITLNAGECYLCISASDDISGTSVNVKGGKKVAVFSGGEIAIPYDGCCYDLVFEQCIPSAYWGRHFVVTASEMRTKDVVRITSLAQGCKIYIDGKYKKRIGARQYYEYKLDGEKKEAVYISTSSPASVCLYLTSASMGGIMGDPSMVNINPIEQQMDQVTFASYNTTITKHHFVNVVTQSSHVKGMTLDNASIASVFKPVPAKKELSYARLDIEHGSHTLASANGGFVAHIYGLGPYESYAYTIGSNSKVLNEFDEEGNLILSNISDDSDDAEGAGNEDDQAVQTYTRTDTLPAVELRGITLQQLKRDVNVGGVLKDPGSLTINPTRYDVTAESDYDYLFDGIDAMVVGDSILLHFRPRNEWCDCFVPKKLRVNVVLVPNFDEGDGAARVVIPVVVPVDKEGTWLSRCLWVLLSCGGLLVLIFYLMLLLRKNRFKKNAMVTPIYFNYYGKPIDDQGGTLLRKKGLIAWFARWFLPGDERATLQWDSPSATISFVAADSNDVVNLPKRGNIDTRDISISGYDPKRDTAPEQPYMLGTNGRINIKKSDGSKAGHLIFTSGDRNDGVAYRLLLIILIGVSALAILVLLLLMVRGLM